VNYAGLGINIKTLNLMMMSSWPFLMVLRKGMTPRQITVKLRIPVDW